MADDTLRDQPLPMGKRRKEKRMSIDQQMDASVSTKKKPRTSEDFSQFCEIVLEYEKYKGPDKEVDPPKVAVPFSCEITENEAGRSASQPSSSSFSVSGSPTGPSDALTLHPAPNQPVRIPQESQNNLNNQDSGRNSPAESVHSSTTYEPRSSESDRSSSPSIISSDEENNDAQNQVHDRHPLPDDRPNNIITEENNDAENQDHNRHPMPDDRNNNIITEESQNDLNNQDNVSNSTEESSDIDKPHSSVSEVVGSSSSIPEDEDDLDFISCFCAEPYAGRPMIECDKCLTWIHMSCVNIKESEIPDTFKCPDCK